MLNQSHALTKAHVSSRTADIARFLQPTCKSRLIENTSILIVWVTFNVAFIFSTAPQVNEPVCTTFAISALIWKVKSDF